MPNVQFCPVCGYALKRPERQCGRCGEELVGSPRDAGQETPEKITATRWGSDYTIEAISFGGAAPSGSGIRELSQTKEGENRKKPFHADAAEPQQVIEDLRKQISDMNSKMASVMNETAARQSASGGRQAEEAGLENTRRKMNVRKLRKRTDPEFKALVEKHLRRIREMQVATPDVRQSMDVKHLDFISEKIVSPGLPDESVVLFVGAPGTMKSILAADIMLKIARKERRDILYVLLGESSKEFESRLMQMGIMREGEKSLMHIVDRKEIMKNAGSMQGTWRRLLMHYIDEQTKQNNYSLLVLDNLNALASMVVGEKTRNAVFEFFEGCRNRGLTAFAIKEGSYERSISEKSAEAYLADGVVQFINAGSPAQGTVTVLRMMKMRGARIDSSYFAIQFVSGSLKIVPSVVV